jgi:hypothetical protein
LSPEMQTNVICAQKHEKTERWIWVEMELLVTKQNPTQNANLVQNVRVLHKKTLKRLENAS